MRSTLGSLPHTRPHTRAGSDSPASGAPGTPCRDKRMPWDPRLCSAPSREEDVRGARAVVPRADGTRSLFVAVRPRATPGKLGPRAACASDSSAGRGSPSCLICFARGAAPMGTREAASAPAGEKAPSGGACAIVGSESVAQRGLGALGLPRADISWDPPMRSRRVDMSRRCAYWSTLPRSLDVVSSADDERPPHARRSTPPRPGPSARRLATKPCMP